MPAAGGRRSLPKLDVALLVLPGKFHGGAGGPVDDGEVGAEDGGEGQRVQEAARLHLAVHGGRLPGRQPVRRRRTAVGCRRRRRHLSRLEEREGAECVALIVVAKE